MEETAFASSISVIFAIKPGASHARLSLCAAGEPAREGAKGGKMLTSSIIVLGKGKDGRVSLVLPWAQRGVFPLAPLGSSPAAAGGSDFNLSTKMLTCLVFPLENLDFWKGKLLGHPVAPLPLCQANVQTKSPPGMEKWHFFICIRRICDEKCPGSWSRASLVIPHPDCGCLSGHAPYLQPLLN